MAEASPNNQMLSALLFGPQNAVKLQQAQQNQALANAILQQGLTPVSTEGRQIGGVGYRVSPLEGLAKLADVISGKVQQNQAIQDQADIYGKMGSSLSSSGGSDPFRDAQGKLSPLATAELLSGNRAVAEMVRPTEQQKNFGDKLPVWVNNQVNPGARTYQENLGSTAAGMAPAGTLPPGVGGSQSSGAAIPSSAIPPMDANQLQPNAPAPSQGIQLSGPPPGTAPPAISATSPTMPSPSSGETNDQYQARLKAAQAGASAQASEVGTATGEAIKGAANTDAMFNNALTSLQDLKKLAPDTSASHWWLPEDTQHKYLQQNDPKTASVNAQYETIAARLKNQEMAPLIQAMGGRGNQFVEKLISLQSAPDIGLNQKAKEDAIGQVIETINQARENVHNRVGNLTGQPQAAPSGWSIKKVSE